MKGTNDDREFERAFVAVSYLLGRREGLTEGLENPGEAAAAFAAGLTSPERTERAQRLSEALSPVASDLLARGLR
jgi:hypothetical protein